MQLTKLTLRSGRFGDDASTSGGGAIRFRGGSLIADQIIINDSVVRGVDLPGGAIDFVGGTLELVDSTLRGNNTSGRGGAIYADAERLVIRGSEVSANTSSIGGGVWTSADVVEINGSTFNANVAESGDGGAIFAIGGSTSIDLSLFEQNRAGRSGGGLTQIDGDIVVAGSILTGNRAERSGGALLLHDSAASISQSTVADNHAELSGGGLWMSVSDLNAVWDSAFVMDIHNTLLSGNHAQTAADLNYVGDETLFRTRYSIVSIGDGTPLASTTGPDVNGNFVGTADQPILPGIGSIGDHGGTMRSMPIAFDSIALNAGDPMSTNEEVGSHDLRGEGFDRIVGPRIDIGANEFTPVRTVSDHIYGVDTQSVLFELHPESGAVNVIGELDVPLTDLALSPQGDLLGVTPTGGLYRVDWRNASTTLVVNLGVAVSAIAFDSRGQIYVGGDRLHRIDPQSFVPQLLPTTDSVPILGDMVFDIHDNLYAISDDSRLIKRSASSGVFHTIGTVDATDVQGLVWTNDMLLAVSGVTSEIFVIDPVDATTNLRVGFRSAAGIDRFVGGTRRFDRPGEFNQTPTIAPIASVRIDSANPNPAISVNIRDDGDLNNLRITLDHDNTDLFPEATIQLERFDFEHHITFNPKTERSGRATVTLRIEDAFGARATRRFDVIVATPPHSGLASSSHDWNTVHNDNPEHHIAHLFRAIADAVFTMDVSHLSDDARGDIAIINSSFDPVHRGGPTSISTTLREGETYAILLPPSLDEIPLTASSDNNRVEAISIARTNFFNRYDVNGDGSVDVVDALSVIGQIRRNTSLGNDETLSDAVFGGFSDVNDDGVTDVTDALSVINQLRRNQKLGESESTVGHVTTPVDTTSMRLASQLPKRKRWSFDS